jgi:hypothetical protein
MNQIKQEAKDNRSANDNKDIVVSAALLRGVGKVSQESGVMVAQILRRKGGWSVRRPPTAESAPGKHRVRCVV